MRTNREAEFYLQSGVVPGGSEAFSQPSGLSAAGGWIYLCDRGRNRVLGWRHETPLESAADLILGQPNGAGAEPGSSPGELNWPCGVAAAANVLAVADTWNDRLLLWMPRPNSARAPDVILPVARPWDVWTDGTRLAVAAEETGALLLWRSMPTGRASLPDARLDAVGQMGSPRSIATDGRTWMVADAESGSSGGPQGNFVWRDLTADSQPHDFFLPRPADSPLWLQGSGDASGFWMVGGDLMHWRSAPEGETAAPGFRLRGLSAGLLPGADTCVARRGLLVSQPEQNQLAILRPLRGGGFGGPDQRVGTAPPSPAMWGMRLAAGDGWLAAVDPATESIRTWAAVVPAAPSSTTRTEIPYRAAAAWGDTLFVGSGTRIDAFIFDSGRLRPARPSEAPLEGLSGLPPIGSIAGDGSTLAVAAADGALVLLFRRQDGGWRICGRLFAAGPAQLGLLGSWLAVSAAGGAALHRLDASGEPSRGRPLKLPAGGSPAGVAIRSQELVLVDAQRHELLGWRSVASAAEGEGPAWSSGDSANPRGPGIGRNRLAHPNSVALTPGLALVAEHSVSNRIVAYRCDR